MENCVIIDKEKSEIKISDGANRQKFSIWLLTFVVIINGFILSYNEISSFIPILGRIFIVLGFIMLYFVLFKLNYKDQYAFSEIKSFTIKKSMGKTLPSLKLNNGKIRRIFKPISPENSAFLLEKFPEKP